MTRLATSTMAGTYAETHTGFAILPQFIAAKRAHMTQAHTEMEKETEGACACVTVKLGGGRGCPTTCGRGSGQCLSVWESFPIAPGKAWQSPSLKQTQITQHVKGSRFVGMMTALLADLFRTQPGAHLLHDEPTYPAKHVHTPVLPVSARRYLDPSRNSQMIYSTRVTCRSAEASTSTDEPILAHGTLCK